MARCSEAYIGVQLEPSGCLGFLDSKKEEVDAAPSVQAQNWHSIISAIC
jgi:hypothetical protein